jgi:hypothetical protein
MTQLVGDRLKLVRRINKLLPNLACKLVYGDKVAYAEAKAHRDLKYNTVIVASERKSYSEEKFLHPDCADICRHKDREAIAVGSAGHVVTA